MVEQNAKSASLLLRQVVSAWSGQRLIRGELNSVTSGARLFAVMKNLDSRTVSGPSAIAGRSVDGRAPRLVG